MFTVVIPYRCKKEYDNFLHLKEVVESINQPVLISVFGDMDHRIEDLDVSYLHTQTDHKWNRSRALNLGVDATETEFVFTNDADCRWVKDIGEDLCSVFDQGGHVIYRVASNGSINSHGAGMQGYNKNWSIRWDEQFVGYGREDIDMAMQAKKCGLKTIELHGGIEHLEHPRNEMLTDWRKNKYKFSKKWGY